MPPRRRPDAVLEEVNRRDDVAQLRQQVELLTQQVAALLSLQQPPVAPPQENIEEENPFAQVDDEPIDPPIHRRAGPPDNNRRWEAGFKVDIPEFHGGLQPEEFLDWLIAAEEVLDFKEVPADKRVPLIATRFRGRAAA